MLGNRCGGAIQAGDEDIMAAGQRYSGRDQEAVYSGGMQNVRQRQKTSGVSLHVQGKRSAALHVCAGWISRATLPGDCELETT